MLGYGRGVFAPGRSSDRARSEEGDSSTEPWIVAHNLILSHAAAVKVYREEFKPAQQGQIGITLNGDWEVPYDNSPESETSLLLPFFPFQPPSYSSQLLQSASHGH